MSTAKKGADKKVAAAPKAAAKPAAKPAATVTKAAPKAAAKPASKGAKGKKLKTAAQEWKGAHSHLFKKNAKVFKVGRDTKPGRDLSRFVNWPQYIRLQRQRAILRRRLKVPPAIHQFTKAVQGSQAKELFRLLKNYRPESPEDKKKRLKDEAAKEAKKEGSSSDKKAPPLALKFGLNHITTLIEKKEAKLVVIAHDVDPIDLVVWLPALCRKMDVPYCIVKGKSRLGHLVYKKNAAVVALTDVRKEHGAIFQTLVQTLRISYNDNVSTRTEWGGGIMGTKFQNQARAFEKAAAKKLSSK
jgi:large subunit ribosomal protein L7Ae